LTNDVLTPWLMLLVWTGRVISKQLQQTVKFAFYPATSINLIIRKSLDQNYGERLLGREFYGMDGPQPHPKPQAPTYTATAFNNRQDSGDLGMNTLWLGHFPMDILMDSFGTFCLLYYLNNHYHHFNVFSVRLDCALARPLINFFNEQLSLGHWAGFLPTSRGK
jgi:hypothetical protein